MNADRMMELPEVPSAVIARGAMKRIMELSLVLASQTIPHRIVFDDGNYGLETGAEDQQRAEELLQLYLGENRGWRAGGVQPGELRLLTSPFLLLSVPTGIFILQAWNLFNPTRLVWAGRCHSEKIMAGEWWRTVTGLTLHGSTEHFLSNLLSGYFILNLLANRINIGLSAMAVTLLAAAANFATAAASPSDHLSLGFSTAVFSALGCLAGVQVSDNLKEKNPARKNWAPLIAAFFMVILMGLGEGTDIRAHVFGFATGAAGGFVLPGLHLITRKPWVQAGLVTAAWGIFGLSWRLALR